MQYPQSQRSCRIDPACLDCLSNSTFTNPTVAGEGGIIPNALLQFVITGILETGHFFLNRNKRPAFIEDV